MFFVLLEGLLEEFFLFNKTYEVCCVFFLIVFSCSLFFSTF